MLLLQSRHIEWLPVEGGEGRGGEADNKFVIEGFGLIWQESRCAVPALSRKTTVKPVFTTEFDKYMCQL